MEIKNMNNIEIKAEGSEEVHKVLEEISKKMDEIQDLSMKLAHLGVEVNFKLLRKGWGK